MPRRPAGRSHPTRVALLEATVEIIVAKGADGVTLDEVLQLAHASKGSLYHHFVDLSELVEEAQVRLYGELAAADVASLAYLIEHAGSALELRQRIADAALGIFDPGRREVRAQRAGVVVASAHGSDAMRASLIADTRQLVGEFADVIVLAQQRGFVRSDVDAEATATLLLALAFGQVFIEVAEVEPGPRRSAVAYIQLLDGILIADDVGPVGIEPTTEGL